MKIKISPLDRLFSRYIRLRDGGICQKCHKYLGLTGGLHCSHFHSRRKQSTRYDEMNCVALCFGCHQYFGENRDEYEVWFKDHIGEREFDLLNARMRVIGKPDEELIWLYLKEKINSIKK